MNLEVLATVSTEEIDSIYQVAENNVSNFIITYTVISIALFIFFLLVFMFKRKKNYSRLDEKEKVSFDSVRQKTKKAIIIGLLFVVVFTIALNIKWNFSNEQSRNEMLSSGALVQTQTAPSLVQVEQCFMFFILIFYVIFRIYIKVSKNITDEEKLVLKKAYSGVTTMIVIFNVITFIWSFIATALNIWNV